MVGLSRYTCRAHVHTVVWNGCAISCLLQVDNMEEDLEGREGRIEELKKKYVILCLVLMLHVQCCSHV